MQILAPVVRGRKGEHEDKLANARRDGFVRVRVDAEIRNLDEEIELKKNNKHNIEIIVDRIVLKEGIRSRLADSVETSIEVADGLVLIIIDDKEYLYSTKLSCPNCAVSIPELSPRMFSFNSPYGACQKCGGLGFIMRFSPDFIISDPNKSLYDGVLEVWGKSTSYWYREQIHTLEKNFNFDAHAPWQELPEKVKDVILYGSGSKKNEF